MPSVLRADFTHALRGLLRQRGFFLTAVLTLALGVGSVSAIFSVVNGVLLAPLPYPDAERIVRIDSERGVYGGPVSGAVVVDWREGTESAFEALGAFGDHTATLVGTGEAEQLYGVRVTPEFWEVMGLGPMLGRYFGVAEEAGNERVVVLGHALWVRRFGADPGVIGRDIVLDNVSHRIVGVTPPEFRYPNNAQYYLPTHLPSSTLDRGTSWLSVIARLRPEVDPAQADAAVEQVNARLANDYPDDDKEMSAHLTSLPERLTGYVREPLLILLAASLLVLLIACANLANLLLARGSQRTRELAVRAALGASRVRLIKTTLAEATVIALAGGVAGVALAAVAVPLLLASAPDLMPDHSAVEVNFIVLAVSLVLALATVLVFALWPALRSAAAVPAGALQEEGRGGAGGRRRSRARTVLVVSEIALSLTLLAGAGLLIESLRRLGDVDTGVVTDRVLTASIVLSAPPGAPEEGWQDLYRRLSTAVAPRLDRVLERVAALPGVQRVGLSDALPLSGRNNISSSVEIVGRDLEALGIDKVGAQWRFVNPDYFATLGIPLVRGRGVQLSDQRPGEFPTTVVINETFARRYLQGVEPLGQQVDFLGGPKTIAGVVADTRLLGYEREAVPEVYMAHGNAIQTQFFLALKVAGEPMAYAQTLRRALHELDPDMPVLQIRSMDDMAAEGTRLRRFNLRLMAIFSAVALALAAVGLYGVIAYSVSQRRQEIGIRMSLGADRRRVLSMVLRQGMGLVLGGVVLGLVGATALARAIASQLYGVGAADPLVLGTTVAVLLAVSLLACLVPAARAARVDPMNALRSL